MTKITATAHNGNSYQYEPYKIGTNFKAIAGNYMFVYMANNGNWTILYIGETKDLSTRFGGHHKLPAAIKKGATHLLVRANNGGEAARKKEEKELIITYKPALNEVHN